MRIPRPPRSDSIPHRIARPPRPRGTARPDGGGRKRSGAAVAVVAVLLSGLAVVGVTTAGPARAASCTKQTASVRDPNTGWTWSSRFVCPNKVGAALYGDTYAWNNAAAMTKTGIMKTSPSWFVCYRRGATHSGGNNVWYYTQGDQSVAPWQPRAAWGYMPAADVSTSTDPWPGMPQCPVGSSPPPRTNGIKPVYFVHGYSNSAATDCAATWKEALDTYRAHGWTDSQLWTFGYYSGDSGCKEEVTGGTERPIKDIAQDFAIQVWDQYSRFGVSVDAVGYSMGGLVIRAAITGVQRHDPGFPPYLYIEDVATLSTPHMGTPAISYLCNLASLSEQCKEMNTTNSSFFSWLTNGTQHLNPQSAQGTDWTLIGADDDLVSPAWSSIAVHSTPWTMQVGHKVVYTKPQPSGVVIGHGTIVHLNSGTFSAIYCDYNDSSCSLMDRNSFHPLPGPPNDPLTVAELATYYMADW